MKTILSILLLLGMVSIPIFAVAADPVDLSGKEGVVDPKDLKQHDPKPPKVEKKAPPPPEKQPDVPPFEVDRGGIDDANVPYTPPSKE